MGFRTRHLLAALVLHGLLFMTLATSVKCTAPVTTPKVIQGVLLDPSRAQVARQQQVQLEQRKKDEAERVERELKEAEDRRQQAELEKAAQEKLEKEKREENKKKKAELAKKTAEDRRKKDEEQKHQQEKKKKLEKQKALEREEQELRNQQLQADAEAAERAVANRQTQQAQDEWVALVAAQVMRNWLRPPDSGDNFQCKVQIDQLPGGQIVSRKMIQSCGSRLLDDSVLKAVDKSDPLPLVSNPAAFQRSFAFIFVPNQ